MKYVHLFIFLKREENAIPLMRLTSRFKIWNWVRDLGFQKCFACKKVMRTESSFLEIHKVDNVGIFVHILNRNSYNFESKFTFAMVLRILIDVLN